MAKAALYTVNTAQEVAVGGTISPGTIIRRFGCGVNLNGNGIIVDRDGYYDIGASFTVVPTVAGIVTITMFRDGEAVPGAVASETAAAAGDSVNLDIDAIVRQGCDCSGGHTLTFVLTGTAASVTNAAVKVVKL